ncbi:MAG: Rrf2 family transcriptional regulator [Desulfobacterales bacterium]|nr:Rrf2 family transcriptional regulator [Desulfobacterales bacterium]
MFSVSARAQYGIRALAYLARRPGWKPLGRRSPRRRAFPGHLEGILTRLAAAGLIRSERGKNGGYRLAGPPEGMVMAEVVAALDGEVRPVDCVDALGICDHDASCLSRRFWIGLKSAIDEYLRNRTLADIIEDGADPGPRTRERGPQRPGRRTRMDRRFVYVDYNATTPLHPAVKARMIEDLEVYANASSLHESGRTARAWIEEARSAVAALDPRQGRLFHHLHQRRLRIEQHRVRHHVPPRPQGTAEGHRHHRHRASLRPQMPRSGSREEGFPVRFLGRGLQGPHGSG